MPLPKTLPPPDRVFPFHHRSFVRRPVLERKSVPRSLPAVPGKDAASALAMPAGAIACCRAVRELTAEMVMLVTERVALRRDRRRLNCHVQQISMYVCHVVLQLSMTDVANAFGRSRSTVGHACQTVEDRREDSAYNDFVSAVERVVAVMFVAAGRADHA
ncbi:helix-turn-helix domain-containing protein [Pararhizobium gei]|uniref:helix-turn-helix domain-containing protein n=1 Tax=Pararhizobium gei TaxID=1395951 RepID=UPI0023D9C1EB|nr:helix-turn-helix domain-containing protein [Rhizobium gei]